MVSRRNYLYRRWIQRMKNLQPRKASIPTCFFCEVAHVHDFIFVSILNTRHFDSFWHNNVTTSSPILVYCSQRTFARVKTYFFTDNGAAQGVLLVKFQNIKFFFTPNLILIAHFIDSCFYTNLNVNSVSDRNRILLCKHVN